jgi:predicted nucleic acid-binding protein
VSGFLLDTNTISLFYRADAGPDFARWVDDQQALNAIYLSAVTIHEIEKGVHLLEQKGAIAKAASIRAWLLGLVAGYGSSVLSLDATVARVSGELEAIAIAAGHAPGAADAMIAGTAKHYGLTIITNNLKHFQPFGTPVLSPDQVVI